MSFYNDCVKVKNASYELASLTTEQKNELLLEFAKALVKNTDAILIANELDLKNARENNMTTAFIDRLTLTKERIEQMAEGVKDIVSLEDPIGRLLEERTISKGIRLKKVSVPLGVIGIIFESRPNVSADSIALCIKSSNVCILKGGKESINSNCAISDIFTNILECKGYDKNFVLMVRDTTRETTNELMRLKGIVDILIPRGGKNLINAVCENSKVPVIETGAGNCHIFVDESADFESATRIIDNAKTQRPSVCNAVETVLVCETVAEKFLPMLRDVLTSKGVEIRGCEKTKAIINDVTLATEEDYETEFNDLILAVKVVSDTKEAVSHIRKYSTHHSEAILSSNDENINYFTSCVDSAAVYVNASTRFTDGAEFGLGAEIGISTQKLHTRGPMGLRELTSYKYILVGDGTIRG